MKKIKEVVVITVALTALGVGMVTHPIYTLGACALIVGIDNLVKLVRAR